MKTKGVVSSLLWVGILSASLFAQASGSARYDATIENNVTHKLAENQKFKDVQSTVEDGIVTLRGAVNLYQDKLDAAKSAKKQKNVQGVRNLIEVAGPVVADANCIQLRASSTLIAWAGTTAHSTITPSV